MKAYLAFFVAVVVIALICITTAKSDPPQPNKLSDFMRVKLEHSKKVLEGLTTEDFGAIAKSSQAMSLLSQDAAWQVLETPEYVRHSQEFRRAADALTEAAKKKNLDGSALAYMELTMKCINCHKYVRTTRVTGSDLTDRPQPRGK